MRIPNCHISLNRRESGFALVVAISIMAFLVILLLTITTLIRVEDVRGGVQKEQQLARANALLGLQAAIGQLQKNLGPDQRISASADLAGTDAGQRLENGSAPGNAATVENTNNGLVSLQAGTRYWTGVWGNTDAAGDAFGKTPNPVLLNWLVSGNHTEYVVSETSGEFGRIESIDASSISYIPSASIQPQLTAAVDPMDTITISGNSGDTRAALMVGPGTAGVQTIAFDSYTELPQDRYVIAPLVDIEGLSGGLSGRYGFWIGDEGVKARANLVDPYADSTNSSSSKEARYRLLTAPRSGAEMIGDSAIEFPLKPYLTDATQTGGLANRISTFPELSLLDPNTSDTTQAAVKSRFHALTTHSQGVLADSLNGGLREDLTYYLSQDTLPSNLIDSSTRIAKGILPEEYSPLTQKFVAGRGGGSLREVQVPTWGVLHSYYQMSEEIEQNDSVTIRPHTETEMGVFPMVTTVKMMGGYRYDPDFVSQYNLSGVQTGHYFVSPVFVLANPYDVPITLSATEDLYLSVLVQRAEEKTPSPLAGSGPDPHILCPTPHGFWDMHLQERIQGRINDHTRWLVNDGIWAGGDTENPGIFDSDAFAFHAVKHVDSEGGYGGMIDNCSFYITDLTLEPGEKKIFRVQGKQERRAELGEFGGTPDKHMFYQLEVSDPESIATQYTYLYQMDPVHGGPMQSGLFYIRDGDYENYLPISLEMRTGPPNTTPADSTNKHLLTVGEFNWDFARLTGVDEGDKTIDDDAAALIGGIFYDSEDQAVYEEDDPRPYPFTGIYYLVTWSYNFPGNSMPSLNGINRHLRAYADHNPRASYFGTASVDMGLPVPYTQAWAGPSEFNQIKTNWEALPLSMGQELDGWGFDIEDDIINSAILFNLPHSDDIEEDPLLFTIAQLQHANLNAMDGVQDVGYDYHFSIQNGEEVDLYHYNQGYQPANAIGNSYSSSYVSNDTTIETLSRQPFFGEPASSGPADRRYFDMSHLLNTALWDSYFFSSVTPDNDASTPVLANPRLKTSVGDPSELIPSSSGVDAGKLAASKISINGAFNINSTSEDAWMALIGGMRALPSLPDSASDTSEDSIFPRSIWQPGDSSNVFDRNAEESYNGFRSLTNQQVEELAAAIVRQVRLRGPFLSLGHFINRTLIEKEGDTNNLGDSGPLQAAIDANGADLNQTDASVEEVRYSQDYEGSDVFPAEDKRGGVIENFFRSAKVPGWLSQADLLQAVGSVISARSDTFTIRAYGEATNPVTGEVTGRAWCEAIVTRTPEYVNSGADSAVSDPQQLTDDGNKDFGRRFEVLSVRWLAPEEV